MDPLTLRPAAVFSHRRLTELLNQAYADYYTPVQFDAYQFAMMCDDMDIDLTRSIVAVSARKSSNTPRSMPVGMALLAVRGSEGWISAVGVQPAWRRCGVGRAILRRMQQDAHAFGLDALRLEVLAQNQAGVRLYDSLGFTVTRDLMVLRMAPGFEPAEPVTCLDIRGLNPQKLLKYYVEFHDVDPSWQRGLRSLQKRASRVRGWGFFREDRLVGYVIFQTQTEVILILDLAVAPGMPDRVEIGRQLLVALHAALPSLGGYVINMPAEDPLSQAFMGLGYRVMQCQHEMVWPVTSLPLDDEA